MSKNDKNPLIDAKKIQEAVALNVENAFKSIADKTIKEEMRKIIKESPEEDYEEEVVGQEVENEEPVEEPAEEGPVDGEAIEMEDSVEGGEDFPAEEGNVEGEEEVDLIDAPDEDVIKVFKKIESDSEVEVVKTDTGFEITDNETGAEYIINVGGQDVEISDDTELEVNEANLGYTNYYQKPVTKSSPKVDASFKGTREWDKGVPDGANQTRGKVGKGDPFNENTEPITEEDVVEEDVEEVDESLVRTMGHLRYRASKKSEPEVKDMVKKGRGGYAVRDGASLKTEEKLVQLENQVKELKNNELILKETVKQFREAAQQYYVTAHETALTNYKLGKIFNLFTENSTTLEEKRSILDRLQVGKTTEQVDSLYESIKAELKNKQPLTENIDKAFVAEAPSKTEKIFVNEEVKRSLELMAKINH